MNNVNPKLQELLLLSCVNSEPFSTVLLNPFSGSSVRSFRGAQGCTMGIVEPLGRNPRHLLMSVFDKQLLYTSSIGTKSGNFTTRSIMPGVIKSLVSHPSGCFVFASIGNKIYTWTSSTGELLSLTDDAFQNFTVLKVSSCGSYLIAGVADGSIKVFLVSDLIVERQHQIEQIKAQWTFLVHNLAVSDIYITHGSNPRILSVSLDHTIVMSSLCTRYPLLRISADSPITSCCMDPAESRIIVGTKKGKVCVLDLFSQHRSENFININGMTEQNGIQIFDHPSDETHEICKISINFDGSLLASADSAGNYCIWDLSNGQCLKSANMKGRISTLKFVEYWPELRLGERTILKRSKRNNEKPVLLKFQQNFSTPTTTHEESQIVKPTATEEKQLLEKIDDFISAVSSSKSKQFSLLGEDESQKEMWAKVHLDENSVIPLELNDSNNNPNDEDIIEIRSIDLNNSSDLENTKKSDMLKSKRIRALEQEVKRLMKINHELYEFAVHVVTEDAMRE